VRNTYLSLCMNKQISFIISAAIMLTALVTAAVYPGHEANAQTPNMTNATAAAGANMTNATAAVHTH
jgi:hypothetical protein